MIIYIADDSSGRHPIVLWNVIFIAINAAQIILMIYGETRVQFNDAEQELYDKLFRGFTKLEFIKLLKHGYWKSFGPQCKLISEGQDMQCVFVIYRGRVKIEVHERRVAEISQGQFLGEMSFLTGERASATCTTLELTKCLCWNTAELNALLTSQPSLRFGLESVIGADLTRKLKKVSVDEAESSENR